MDGRHEQDDHQYVAVSHDNPTLPSLHMGCGGSKADDLPLVRLCRERRDLIRAASHHRYALAAAHLAYFQSLKDVGDAIRKFVDEELVIASPSASSSPDSPVLNLPSDEGKSARNKTKISSSSTSISHKEEDIEDSHLHLSSPSGSLSGSDSPSGHIHNDDSSGHIHFESSSPEKEEEMPEIYPPRYGYPMGNWGFPGENSGMYYMKKSATPAQSFIYEDPERHQTANMQWQGPGYGYPGYLPYPPAGFFGYSPPNESYNRQPSPPPPPPAPPSPPSVSTWDFLNVFETFDANSSGYPSYYPQSRYGYGYGSTTSSPDSKEVREREGIPELEEETEQQVVKEVFEEKKKLNEHEDKHPSNKNKTMNSGEGTSRAVPRQNDAEGVSSSKGVMPSSLNSESTDAATQGKESNSSHYTSVSKSSEEEQARKKGVTFEVGETSTSNVESSEPSSLSALSVHGTRDLQEVVKEIRDEFETASSYGREVAMLLEVSKLPYQRRNTGFKVIFSRILYLVAPSVLSSRRPLRSSIRLTSRIMKMAKAYSAEPDKDFNLKPGNLSSTLEKLYAWEKKLYKEVKDEERLRVVYERKCKRLRSLDDRGAESSKIDATRASIRKLLTKIDICIKSVDSISSRIHKLRDEELRPQLAGLIHGLIRMWRSMLKCHQKQFQAIMESKVRSFKANIGLQRDSGLKATLELEMELLNWSTHFNNWVGTQKAYVESLNGWLSRCLLYEPEETADGFAPFSPSRIGAPPIFVICNDWYQAVVRISEKEVANAMNDFALGLHQLWERQDEEQRQRIKAEYMSKDFEKRLRTLRMERGKLEDDQDALSEKTAISKVTSESGISKLDDLKVDLDSMRKKLEGERARHKEAIKSVNKAASSSLQGGLIPIFESLGNFTSEVLKAHEQVRLENTGNP